MLNDSAKNFYEFDSFQVDARRRLLFHEGQPVRVTPKAFDILLGLVRSGGRVISKDELMTTIWPNCFVEEGNLAQNIFLLRRVLGERKNEHKYIITIPGVGYRFAPYVRESAVTPTIRKVASGSDQKITCIAVLPFKSISQNETSPSFGIGMADAIITKLCTLKFVNVIPTSAVLRLVEPSPGPWLAASELEIDALLDGFYQHEGEHLRLSIQLVGAANGTMLWASKFDAELTNLFALEDSLSEQVVNALAEKLGSSDQPRLSVVRQNREANLRRCS
jgi:DNA-binding winged helix-turn-helix (wHTH) protein